MSYVDALLDRKNGKIKVVERDAGGNRVYRNYPIEYGFYYESPEGDHRSVNLRSQSETDRRPLLRYDARNLDDMRERLKQVRRPYENDLDAVHEVLAKHYPTNDEPDLHTVFFDIETDYDKDTGFAPPNDPFHAVTAVSMYMDWMPEAQRLVTLCIKPATLSKAQAAAICGKFDNTYLYDTEQEMLADFLDLIDDADVLTGWNSEGFDIPYMVNRTERIIGREAPRKFCLFGRRPTRRTFKNAHGADMSSYELHGRVHIDYLELYRKYTYQERHSYSLDAIGEIEVGEKKVAYDHTIDYMYNYDFERFIDYSRQDVALLVKIDERTKFLDLINSLAHSNKVTLPKTLGTVAQTDQAIINEAHNQGMRIPARSQRWQKDELPDPAAPYDMLSAVKAVGAYVADPVTGMHEWIGSIDINSLYPSIIRALNMSPETLVAQFSPKFTNDFVNARKREMGKKFNFTEVWESHFGLLEYELVMLKSRDEELELVFEDGDTMTGTPAFFYDYIFEQGRPWCLSANGTVFRTDVPGIIPSLLARWYSERKEMQAKKRAAATELDEAYWDRMQLIRKINLNALYGALLNKGCRFFDIRIGQSVTMTGRRISRHLAAETNRVLAGEYDYRGRAIIYGDTDSVYFSGHPVFEPAIRAGEVDWTKDFVVDLYDQVAAQVNDSFEPFMAENFNCPPEFGRLISGGREIVGERGIYIVKKRYAILVYDEDGVRKDADGKPGKLKVLGLDLKRSDTPKKVQEFLEHLLLEVLKGATEEEAVRLVREFRAEFAAMRPWLKGVPKRVNNLTQRTKEYAADAKAALPGHVRAAINWNEMRANHDDNESMEIQDGQKTIVCRLKPNDWGITSIAYPIDMDESVLPEWFKSLPFDDERMLEIIVDKKVENLLGILQWDLGKTTVSHSVNTLFAKRAALSPAMAEASRTVAGGNSLMARR